MGVRGTGAGMDNVLIPVRDTPRKRVRKKAPLSSTVTARGVIRRCDPRAVSGVLAAAPREGAGAHGARRAAAELRRVTWRPRGCAQQCPTRSR